MGYENKLNISTTALHKNHCIKILDVLLENDYKKYIIEGTEINKSELEYRIKLLYDDIIADVTNSKYSSEFKKKFVGFNEKQLRSKLKIINTCINLIFDFKLTSINKKRDKYIIDIVGYKK